MTNAELLKKVKDALSISGNYQDATLNVYIEEVKEYLKSAGIAAETIQGIKCVGIICRGVTDLWAYGVGEGKLSSYFMQRVSQLVLDEKKIIADKPQEPGSDSSLTEEQLAKINAILIYGDGSNVLTDSGEYVNFETTVKEIIDKSGGVGESGKDGKDGFSPIAKVTKTGEITTVSITDKNGTTTAKIYDGANGKDGVDGSNGVGIAKIEKTATVGLIDTYTIFYTNNTTTTFTVKNGKDGANGSGGSESVDLSNYYNKSEVDSKEDLTDKPTIPSVEGLATETYVDNAVSSVPVYDDAEIKASVADLQTNKASKTDIADFQTQAQVKSLVSSEIAKIVANAPSNFDTLKEIADWIATHENSASAMNTAITANTQAIANCVKKTDITISATDIGEGSTLADGALYFVYE